MLLLLLVVGTNKGLKPAQKLNVGGAVLGWDPPEGSAGSWQVN